VSRCLDVQILTQDRHVDVRVRPGLSARLGAEEQGEMHVLPVPQDLSEL